MLYIHSLHNLLITTCVSGRFLYAGLNLILNMLKMCSCTEHLKDKHVIKCVFFTCFLYIGEKMCLERIEISIFIDNLI